VAQTVLQPRHSSSPDRPDIFQKTSTHNCTFQNTKLGHFQGWGGKEVYQENLRMKNNFEQSQLKYAKGRHICHRHTLKTSVSSTYEMLMRYSRPNSKVDIFS